MKIAAAVACVHFAACTHFAWAAADLDRIQIPFQKRSKPGERSWTANTQMSWQAFFRAPFDQLVQP